MKKLAIFDIDFTITKKETFIQLFIYSIKKDIKNIKYIPRAIYSGVMYGLGFFDEKAVKECFIKFLVNKDESTLKRFVRGFYEDVLSKILYTDSINMIKKLKKEGCDVYLISASGEFYLKELYKIKEIDMIIGTRFEFKDGIFTGKTIGKNCKGEEKVHRLKEVLHKKKIEVDFKNSYMFSDSLSDKPLLDLVGNPYLINYKKKTNMKVLKWT